MGLGSDNQGGSDAQRLEFLTGLGARARGLAWSPWGEVARTLRESWEGVLRGDDAPVAVPWDRLGAPRVLLRSGEPMMVSGVGFPRDVRGAVFFKRADAVLEEWILAVAAADGFATVSLQRRGGGSWQHQVDAVGNRLFPAVAGGGFTVATPWGTAATVDDDGYLVEWDSRGAGVLRREGLGALFAGMTPAGFFGRSGQPGAFYFFGAGRMMKVLTRGYFDGRALMSNRGLLSAGRVFAADLADGRGTWREMRAGETAERGPLSTEMPVLSAAVDDATGAVFVERPGGWLRLVDDGTAVHAAAVASDAVPAVLRTSAVAWTGDALLALQAKPEGVFLTCRSC